MFPLTRQQTHTSKKGPMEASVKTRRVNFLCHRRFTTTRDEAEQCSTTKKGMRSLSTKLTNFEESVFSSVI